MQLVVSSYNKEKPSLSLYEIDLKNKTHVVLDEKYLNAPSFVIEGDGYIYTYSKEKIKLVSYKKENNKLILIDEISIPGSTLTHLAYSKKHQSLYAASYADGAYLKVEVKDGIFSNLIYRLQENNSKCHHVALSKNEDNIYVTNISLDEIFIYDFNLNYKESYILPNGVGPRHLIIIDEYLYVVTEYSNEVIVLNNKGEIIQRISTINDYKKESFGATIIEMDGYIYVSNRGMDTIAIYKLNNYHLTFIKMIPSFGNHSRHMIKTSDKKYIISFNKNSNRISFINIEFEREDYYIDYDNVSCGVEIN